MTTKPLYTVDANEDTFLQRGWNLIKGVQIQAFFLNQNEAMAAADSLNKHMHAMNSEKVQDILAIRAQVNNAHICGLTEAKNALEKFGNVADAVDSFKDKGAYNELLQASKELLEEASFDRGLVTTGDGHVEQYGYDETTSRVIERLKTAIKMVEGK